jgi:hypothetical protein
LSTSNVMNRSPNSDIPWIVRRSLEPYFFAEAFLGEVEMIEIEIYASRAFRSDSTEPEKDDNEQVGKFEETLPIIPPPVIHQRDYDICYYAYHFFPIACYTWMVKSGG